MMRRTLLVLFTAGTLASACGNSDENAEPEPTGPPGEGEACLIGGEACDGALQCVADGCFDNTAGTCLEPPADCTDVVEDPVCGCDDETYASRCEAHSLRRNVKYAGACR